MFLVRRRRDGGENQEMVMHWSADELNAVAQILFAAAALMAALRKPPDKDAN